MGVLPEDDNDPRDEDNLGSPYRGKCGGSIRIDAREKAVQDRVEVPA